MLSSHGCRNIPDRRTVHCDGEKSSNLVLQGVSFFYSRVAEGTFYFKIKLGNSFINFFSFDCHVIVLGDLIAVLSMSHNKLNESGGTGNF